MKKLLAILLLITLSLTLWSCDQNDGEDTPEQQTSHTESTTTQAQNEESKPEYADTKMTSYLKAVKLLEKGNIQEAYDIFLTIKDYGNVEEYLERFSFQPQVSFYKTCDYEEVFRQEYDEYGRLVEKTSFLSSVDSLKYLRYEYDENGYLIREENERVSFHFDVTTYEYDEKGNVVRQNDSNGRVVTAEYDEAGNMTRVTIYASYLPPEVDIDRTYEYNDEGKLIKETRQDSYSKDATSYEYDDNGNMIEETNEYIYYPGDYCRSTRIEYDYNDKGVCIRQSHYFSGSAEPEKVLTWEYDENGKLLKEVRKYDTRTYSVYQHEYDTHGNRIKTTTSSNDGVSCITYYEYDAYGNILKENMENLNYPNKNTSRLYYGYELYYNPITTKELPDDFGGKG